MKINANQVKKITILLSLPLFILSCNSNLNADKLSTLEEQKDSLIVVIEYRDSLMNDMMEVFYQIEKDLAFIKEERNIISITSDNKEIQETGKNQIVQDVRELSILLQENQKSLIALNKKLKKSGIKIKNLEMRIAELSKSVDDRNNELLSLKNELEKKDYEVTVLNEQIVILEIENEEQEALISDQVLTINDHNKAYYTLGTKKELIEKGLVTQEGGFLGIGKTKSLSSEIDMNYFSEIDVRNTNNIEVNAIEAELISEHPSGSYEFKKNEAQITTLAINDANEFYKFSKFVVLEIK